MSEARGIRRADEARVDQSHSAQYGRGAIGFPFSAAAYPTSPNACHPSSSWNKRVIPSRIAAAAGATAASGVGKMPDWPSARVISPMK